ncbi:MAG: tyrosine-type recombinase/integrase [Hyphomonadaceae bacterium]
MKVCGAPAFAAVRPHPRTLLVRGALKYQHRIPKYQHMLSDVKLRSLKPRARAYKVSDAEGLFLLVTTNGSRLWRWSYRFGGKQKLMAMGRYPEVGLADARDRMREAKKALARGLDPSATRKAEKEKQRKANGDTFEGVAIDWFETNKARWVESYASRLKTRLEEDLIPSLGSLPIASITPTQVLEAIRKIEQRDAIETAKRILQMARQIFHFGIATGRCNGDPTATLGKALRPAKPPKSRTPLKAGDIPEFYAALKDSDLNHSTKAALEFALLTFVRTAEIRGASWNELEDLDGEMPLWRIPPERMKMRKEHLVPLSPQAVRVVKQIKESPPSTKYVFATRENHTLSENTLIYGLYRLGFHGRATVHGFRSTASTILNEQGFNRDWVEKQLAHEENSVRSIYNAAEWLEGRREMMLWWASYLDRTSGRTSLRLTG